MYPQMGIDIVLVGTGYERQTCGWMSFTLLGY